MSGKVAWGVMTVFAILIALYALTVALVPGLRPPFVAELFGKNSLGTLGHTAIGGLALGCGAFQFSGRLRTERAAVHRTLGKIYVVAVIVSGTSALMLAPSSTGGPPAHFGFAFLGVLWVTTAVVAYVRVRGRDYQAHREWMIRSYSLCLAAVMLRLYLPAAQMMGFRFEDAYPVIAWICWVPNLVIAEWFFVRSRFFSLEGAA